MAKSSGELQEVVLDRNKQVIPLRSKTGREKQMPFLPEEIIYKIFLLLPAKVLQEVMRLVCRSWLRVIRDPVFTKEHFSQSTYKSRYGILKSKDYFELYYEDEDEDESAWILTKRIDQIYLADGVGLILTAGHDDGSLIYLLNPITTKVVALPYFSVKYHKLQNWAVGCSQSTSKYKVLCCAFNSRRAYILTVGVDKQWREIVGSMAARITCFSDIPPIEICGFMYWYQPWCERVIRLDLEKEIFYEVDFHKNCIGRWVKPAAIQIPSDRFLTIAVEHYYKRWQWDIWELLDFKNGGEWRKFGSIDLVDKMSEINKIMGLSSNVELQDRIWPVAAMKDEVIYKHYDYIYFFAYDFKKGTISRFCNNIDIRLKVMFANSLVEL